jgi:hypothetical protein
MGLWTVTPDEPDPHPAERGIDHPLLAVSPHLRAREACSLVDLRRPARDVNADVLDVVHGALAVFGR